MNSFFRGFVRLAAVLAVSSALTTPLSAVEMRSIVDHTGQLVKIPVKIERIVILGPYPLPSVFCLFEGSARRLVGIHPSSMAAARHSLLPKAVPDILKSKTQFVQGDNLNIEELLNLHPDVVFYRAEDQASREKLVEAGIPAVAFSTAQQKFNTIATFESWIKLLGVVLQEKDRAAGIADYGRQVYREVQNRLASTTSLSKPRVLILFSYTGGVMRTSGDKFYGQFWIDASGGVNVARELKGTAEINMEQIYAWNPDIIYITNFCPVLPEDLMKNRMEGQDWSQVKAVKEGHVYKFPLGMYRGFPPASDTPLTLLWLVKHNQPELFSDLDLKSRIRDYYKRFYGMALSDADLAAMLNPVREAAGE